MKRLIFASALFLASSGLIMAYSGNHSFLNANTSTSNGHTYTSDYVATGAFPYNGSGNYDGSKVNLVGTYSLYSTDGTAYDPPIQYCVKTTGSINRRGTGKLTQKIYSDLSCSILRDTDSLTVKKYTEDVSGNFTLVTDAYGVTYTTTGNHSYGQ